MGRGNGRWIYFGMSFNTGKWGIKMCSWDLNVYIDINFDQPTVSAASVKPLRRWTPVDDGVARAWTTLGWTFFGAWESLTDFLVWA